MKKALLTYYETGLTATLKSQGNWFIFQGQGKVREICELVSEVSHLMKIREKSGKNCSRTRLVLWP